MTGFSANPVINPVPNDTFQTSKLNEFSASLPKARGFHLVASSWLIDWFLVFSLTPL